jgi:hypothetical protein
MAESPHCTYSSYLHKFQAQNIVPLFQVDKFCKILKIFSSVFVPYNRKAKIILQIHAMVRPLRPLVVSGPHFKNHCTKVYCLSFLLSCPFLMKNIQFWSQMFFAMCRRKTDDRDVGGERVRRVGRDKFVDRLIHVDVTNHYNSDGSSSLGATA